MLHEELKKLIQHYLDKAKKILAPRQHPKNPRCPRCSMDYSREVQCPKKWARHKTYTSWHPTCKRTSYHKHYICTNCRERFIR